jgi:hypothetical protein
MGLLALDQVKSSRCAAEYCENRHVLVAPPKSLVFERFAFVAQETRCELLAGTARTRGGTEETASTPKNKTKQG